MKSGRNRAEWPRERPIQVYRPQLRTITAAIDARGRLCGPRTAFVPCHQQPGPRLVDPLQNRRIRRRPVTSGYTPCFACTTPTGTPMSQTDTAVNGTASPRPQPLERHRPGPDRRLRRPRCRLRACSPGIAANGFGVPITFQTLAVMLTGLMLGPGRAFAAVGLYTLLGLAGLPIFSQGRSGLGILAGPSAGYIIAFPIAAAAGRLARHRGHPPHHTCPGARGSFRGRHGDQHPGGARPRRRRHHDQHQAGLVQAFLADLVFYPGDMIKNILAVDDRRGPAPGVPRRAGPPCQAAAAPADLSQLATASEHHFLPDRAAVRRSRRQPPGAQDAAPRTSRWS